MVGHEEELLRSRDDGALGAGYGVTMKRIPIALIAALALVLGACGDDDDAPEEAATTTSEAEADASTTSTSTTVREGDLERDDPGTDNTTPSQGVIELEATLSGGTGGGGGSGVASVRVDVNNRELCFTLGTQSMENATAAHIHDGLEGETGDMVVALAPPQNGSVDGCVRKIEPQLATKIAGNPERYYVDVHTGNETDAAIRGQLEAKP